MRRLLFAATLLAPFVIAPIAPGCSSNQAAQDQDGDAGDASASEDVGTVISINYDASDDVGMGTGFPDAGVVDTGALTCATTSDCLVPGYVCGYAATAGCSAVGTCVYGDPPTDPHGVTQAACGCGHDGGGGGTVLYVSPGETSAPVSSASPCVDASAPLDSGSDAALDATVDASDAGNGSDASDAGNGSDASDAGNGSDAGDASSSSPAVGCTTSGGTVGVSQCCPAAGSYPDTCNGPCNGGCNPATTVPALVCNCSTAQCFSASEGRCIPD